MSKRITVAGVSKYFNLYENHSYQLKDTLTNLIRLRGRKSHKFWALQDLDFTVDEGEVLGIVGRNGSGKSTLLKILSRITVPSTGRIEMYGRVNTLLEVGTGFHPELTGRENVFLNGSILGMSRKEIKAKFDEIVHFAEVETFLDTPIKHFSSGMFVRLAFSVAVHLEPDILIVDEVLAVGDQQFQMKCLHKMEEAMSQGRTVLFVSHDMRAVQRLCKRVIFLDQGRIHSDGEPEQVIAQYLQSFEDKVNVAFPPPERRQGTGAVRFDQIALLNHARLPVEEIAAGADTTFQMHFSCAKPLQDVVFTLSIHSLAGQILLRCVSTVEPKTPFDLVADGFVECRFPKLNLNAGLYLLEIRSSVGGVLADLVNEAMRLRVTSGDFYRGSLPNKQSQVLVDYSWRINPD